tara:strand:+ start:894 stop:1208 length:315 start_codon:yes stop_codon:yes gene_type:complete
MTKQLFEFKKSLIHGSGIFALDKIPSGTELFQTHVLDNDDMKIWGNMKPNCLYNHSKTNANCASKTRNRFKFLVSSRDIEKGEELLVDYTKDKDLQQPKEGWEE